MTGKLRPLALFALVALIGAGCSDDPGEGATAGGKTATARASGGGKDSGRSKAVRFAECMRHNGVGEFPDPDASGELTIDGVVNGTTVDPDGPAWRKAIGACKDLTPSGFTGRRRSDDEQSAALEFAQCMRDHGIADFPDPTPGAPLIDTTRIPSAAGRGALEIPGFTAAQDACSAAHGDDVGLRRP